MYPPTAVLPENVLWRTSSAARGPDTAARRPAPAGQEDVFRARAVASGRRIAGERALADAQRAARNIDTAARRLAAVAAVAAVAVAARRKVIVDAALVDGDHGAGDVEATPIRDTAGVPEVVSVRVGRTADRAVVGHVAVVEGQRAARDKEATPRPIDPGAGALRSSRSRCSG